MDRRRAKFVFIGAGMLVSMILLVWVGTRGSGFSYYLSVSEFLAAPDRADDGFRINGKVVQGSIRRHATGEDVEFTMTDGEAALAVDYHGIIPDTFVDGADVVVQGRLQEDGSFAAHKLLAKCPSKYESAEEYPDAPASPGEPAEVSALR